MISSNASPESNMDRTGQHTYPSITASISTNRRFSAVYVPSDSPTASTQAASTVPSTRASPVMHQSGVYTDATNDLIDWQQSMFYLPQIPQQGELEAMSPTSSHSQSIPSGHVFTSPGVNPVEIVASTPPKNGLKSRYQSERRKAQNRQSQRAYRERKEQQLQDVTNRLEDLENKLEDERSRRSTIERALGAAEAELLDSEARNHQLQRQLTLSRSRNEEMNSKWQLLMAKFKQHASESQVRRRSSDNKVIQIDSSTPPAEDATIK